jgi:tetratricopeptide (TPR) repeat protein
MKKYTEKSLAPDASDLNHKYYVEGCEQYKNGSFNEAATSFHEAIEYWPKDPQAWLALGNSYDELQKPKEAEKCFRKALLYCKPENKDDYTYNLGNSLLDQGKFKEAIKCYTSINQSAEIFEKAQKNLAIAKDELNEKDKKI